MEPERKRFRAAATPPKHLVWRGGIMRHALPLGIEETRESLAAVLPLEENGIPVAGEVVCYADFRYVNVYLLVVYPTGAFRPYALCHCQLFVTQNERTRKNTVMTRHGSPERLIRTPAASPDTVESWKNLGHASQAWSVCFAAGSVLSTAGLQNDDKLRLFSDIALSPQFLPDPRCDAIGSLVLTSDSKRHEFQLDDDGLHYQLKMRDARTRKVVWKQRKSAGQARPTNGPMFTLLHRLMHRPSTAVLGSRFAADKDYMVCFSMLAPFCPKPADHEQLLVITTLPVVLAPLSWKEKSSAFLTVDRQSARPHSNVETIELVSGGIELSTAPSAGLPGRHVVTQFRGVGLRGLRTGDVILSMRFAGTTVATAGEFVGRCNIERFESASITVLRSTALSPVGVNRRLSSLQVMRGYDTMPLVVVFLRELLVLVAQSAAFGACSMDPHLADHIVSFLPMDAWDSKPRGTTMLDLRSALQHAPETLRRTAAELYKSSASKLTFVDLAMFAGAAGPLSYTADGLRAIRLLCLKWIIAERNGRMPLCTAGIKL